MKISMRLTDVDRELLIYMVMAMMVLAHSTEIGQKKNKIHPMFGNEQNP